MLVKITDHIEEIDLNQMKEIEDEDIVLDLKEREYFRSKEITGLLRLINVGKKIKLINANSHIIESIKILRLDKIITILK